MVDPPSSRLRRVKKGGGHMSDRFEQDSHSRHEFAVFGPEWEAWVMSEDSDVKQREVGTVDIPYGANWIGSVSYVEGSIGDIMARSMVRGVEYAVGKSIAVVEFGIQKAKAGIAAVRGVGQ